MSSQMRLRAWLAGGLSLVVAAVSYARSDGALFPVAEPFDSEYLRVSDLHEIHYSLHGNPKGKPVFVLHGGPGFGCYPRLTQYFDPDKFLMILHDQRGSGRSRPLGELRENTTQDLVADIERLREHLGIDGKFLVFGGSWGSTLALAYAEAHPQRVSGLVLRGVFTGTHDEIDHLVSGKGVRAFFPDAVALMEAALPPGSGGLSPEMLHRLINHDDKALARRIADAWTKYSIKIGTLHTPDERVEQGFGDWDPMPGSRIDCHYMINGYFLDEGQLLRDAGKLSHIPAVIINGRYDMICPPVTAYRLHKKLPKSKLIIVEEAGHSEGEEGITRALVTAVAEFE